MRSNKKIMILLSIGVIIAVSAIINYNLSSNLTNIEEKIEIKDENNEVKERIFKNEEEDIYFKNPKESGSWGPGEVPFIYIKNDNWSENSLAWIQVGAGTSENPHIIENVTIDASGASILYGIAIENCIQHFRIYNCTVYNAFGGAESAGIGFQNVSNSQIINNNVYNNANGIGLRECENINIIGNDANWNHHYGIGVINSNDITISGNIVSNNGPEDEDGSAGIGITECNTNTISGNSINDNNVNGINLLSSSYNKISDNNIEGNNEMGILLEDSDDNEIEENEINENDNQGILLEDSDDNEISENVIEDNNDIGIALDNSNENEILDNEVNGNSEWGVFLEESDDNEIKKNDLRDNEKGCVTEDSNCNGNVIEDNTCDDIDLNLAMIYGIVLFFIFIGVFFVLVLIFGNKSAKKDLSKIVDESAENEKISDENLEKLKNILAVSNKIKLERVKNILNLDDKIFDAKIFEWANEFGFIIDGEYLVVTKESLSEFTDALDKKFTEWEQMEKDKDGKLEKL